MRSSVLSPGWQAFQRHQHSVNTRILNADALGAEEALTDLLDDFSAAFVPTAEHVHRRFHSLRKNRSRKQRHRLALANRVARPAHVTEDSSRIGDADQLRYIRDNVTPDELVLLHHIAADETCIEIAHAIGSSPGQVRTRLCRLRDRLRSAA